MSIGAGVSLFPAWSTSNGSGAALLRDAVHYYRMEEASGNRVDVNGGNPWTVGGGSVPSATGKNNNGASVSLANYLTITHADLFPSATGSWTFTFWLNPTSYTEFFNPVPIFVSTSAAGGFDLIRGFGGDTAVTLAVYPTGNTRSLGGDALSTGSFHFVALWHNNSNGTFGMQIDAAVTTTNTVNFTTTGANMRLGWNASTSVNGVFDEMAVFDRALTGPERSLLYNGGAGLFL